MDGARQFYFRPLAKSPGGAGRDALAVFPDGKAAPAGRVSDLAPEKLSQG